MSFKASSDMVFLFFYVQLRGYNHCLLFKKTDFGQLFFKIKRIELFRRIEKALNLCLKLNKMTKSIIITYNELDESLLMALFKKIKVKTETLQPKSEIETESKNYRAKLRKKLTTHADY